jgi:hypothetical protein
VLSFSLVVALLGVLQEMMLVSRAVWEIVLMASPIKVTR